MHVLPVTDADLATLNAWCRDHGKSPFPEGWLPPTGFWVPGVLAAFLFRTDSRVAYIECVISNPNTTKEQRREAMLAVADRIAEQATAEGFLYLLGLTAIESVAEAGRLRGYVISQPKYATMVKRLRKENETNV